MSALRTGALAHATPSEYGERVRGNGTLFGLLFVAVSACTPLQGQDGGDAQNTVDVVMQPSCSPGEMQPCTCAGGVAGWQSCDSDGGYGTCVCTDASNPYTQTCDPGSTSPCGCAGGIPGEQTCNDAGTAYGACACDAGATLD